MVLTYSISSVARKARQPAIAIIRFGLLCYLLHLKPGLIAILAGKVSAASLDVRQPYFSSSLPVSPILSFLLPHL